MVYHDITMMAVITRVLTSIFIGGLLGLERGMKNRPAGLRTYMLVSVGACLIMMTNQYIYQFTGAGDPMRLGAQVVSGIGFLGAGTIVVTRHNQIKGLTTAAGLWASAGVGLALGIGFYEAAIAGAVVIFITLTILSYLDNRMHRKTRYFDIYVQLPSHMSLGKFMNTVREMGYQVEDVRLEYSGDAEDDSRNFLMTLVSQKREDHGEIIAKLHDIALPAHVEIL